MEFGHLEAVPQPKFGDETDHHDYQPLTLRHGARSSKYCTPGLMNVGEIQGERSQVLLPGFSADAVTVCRKIMCFAWSFTEVLEGLCAR